jgi:hypothetical protein
MRGMCFVFTAILGLSVVGTALACDCNKGGGARDAGSVTMQKYGEFGAEPGFSPVGYTMVPGCGATYCNPRPCCTSAWEGYCVRQRGGFGSGCGCGCRAPRFWRAPCCGWDVSSCDECFECDSCVSDSSEGVPAATPKQPTPAQTPAAPAPTPTVDKSSQRVRTGGYYVK